jgi:dienelactone hydrolase
VLRERPEVDASRLGGIGFCFGGSTVLQLARDGRDLKGVVSFHGGLQTKAPAKAGAMKASVLVCTGADDPMIPADQVVAFENEMRTAHADWQVISYGNTLHSFTNKQADGSLNPAILYNEKTDKRSWAAMRDFFQEKFGA